MPDFLYDMLDGTVWLMTSRPFLALLGASFLLFFLTWGLAAIFARIQIFQAHGTFETEIRAYKAWFLSWLFFSLGILLLGIYFFLLQETNFYLAIPFLFVFFFGIILAVVHHSKAAALETAG